MRLDKLTTKFQEALADAQSLALGHDNAYIQPEHLLAAMLQQEDGPKALLARAGVNTARLAQEAQAAIQRLPAVQGQEQVQPAPTSSSCCRRPKRKPSSAATSSSPARCSCWRWPIRAARPGASRRKRA